MYRSKNEEMNELLERLRKYAIWERLDHLLQWDQETQMPEKGSELRAEEVSFVAGRKHEAFLVLNKDNLLDQLLEDSKLTEDDRLIVTRVHRDYIRESKLPQVLVEEISKVSSEGTHAWQKARATNTPKDFLPFLKKMIELKREATEYYGYKESPYDALLEGFEPGLTSSRVDTVFSEVREVTTTLLKELDHAGKTEQISFSHSPVPVYLQKEFNDEISKQIGFDFTAGVTGISTHPFTDNMSPYDVRFTTRYKENNILYALSSTLHEAGHGIYEQGLPYEYYGTPLGSYVSLGIHESQSRFWENQIGRSSEFVANLFDRIKAKFPHIANQSSAEEMYQFLNAVSPGCIRTEADELTYNLHIIIRYEIEKDLFEGGLEVQDIEKTWNKKYNDYLGVIPTTPAEGFLQDVHWSQGLLGYFPTYTLGNLYAAQFAHTMEESIDVFELVKKENYVSIVDWLRENIHQYGRRYNASNLVEQVTGEPLSALYLHKRLKEKVDSILG